MFSISFSKRSRYSLCTAVLHVGYGMGPSFRSTRINRGRISGKRLKSTQKDKVSVVSSKRPQLSARSEIRAAGLADESRSILSPFRGFRDPCYPRLAYAYDQLSHLLGRWTSFEFFSSLSLSLNHSFFPSLFHSLSSYPLSLSFSHSCLFRVPRSWRRPRAIYVKHSRHDSRTSSRPRDRHRRRMQSPWARVRPSRYPVCDFSNSHVIPLIRSISIFEKVPFVSAVSAFKRNRACVLISVTYIISKIKRRN